MSYFSGFIFSKGVCRTLGTIVLLCATDFGDYLESRPFVTGCRELHAVLDNIIHVWIGVITYSIIAPHPWILDHGFVVVALGASLIDLDHFIAARSISPDAAFHAPYRGIFHCTGLAVILIGILYQYRPHWAVLAATAILPHHLRDAQRRGLYLVPFFPLIETPPISKMFVRICLPVFPWILNYLVVPSLLNNRPMDARRIRILDV